MMVGSMMKVDAVIAARAEEGACVFLYAVEAKNGGFIERFPVYSEHQKNCRIRSEHGAAVQCIKTVGRLF